MRPVHRPRTLVGGTDREGFPDRFHRNGSSWPDLSRNTAPPTTMGDECPLSGVVSEPHLPVLERKVPWWPITDYGGNQYWVNSCLPNTKRFGGNFCVWNGMFEVQDRSGRLESANDRADRCVLARRICGWSPVDQRRGFRCFPPCEHELPLPLFAVGPRLQAPGVWLPPGSWLPNRRQRTLMREGWLNILD